MTTKRKKTILIIAFFVLFCVGFSPFGNYSVLQATEIDWPASPMEKISLDGSPEISDLVIYIYDWSVGLLGIFLFFVILYSGIELLWFTAENPGAKKDATKRAKNAAGGIFLLLSVFIILNEINPNLTKLKDIPLNWNQVMIESNKGIFSGEPDCAFALLYKEKDFQGDSSDRLSLGTHYINQEKIQINTKDSSGIAYVQKKEGNEYYSARGFREMTEVEKVSAQYGENLGGRMIIDNKYIEGSSCLLKMYIKRTDWIIFSKEQLVGAALLPASNLEEYLNYADTIKNQSLYFRVENRN